VDQVPLEVADDRVHLQRGVLVDEPLGRGRNGRVIDLHRRVAQRRPAPRLQQAPRLEREAGAELDHVARREIAHQGGGQAAEQSLLDAGGVVLGQAGDLLEEP
jgi:hypothetical protein